MKVVAKTAVLNGHAEYCILLTYI